ncbi:MAG: universal stress protein [Desulfosporosinus sp. BRH_c37]|nr:MAG: universal stress protein [Desulfosporosinus sp. BRH_c37]
MTDPLKVLLYFDGTKHSFSAAVYAANLFNSIPNMDLTVLNIQENVEGPIERDCNLLQTWSTSHHLNWEKQLVEEADTGQRKQYSELMNKTKIIFTKRGHNVKQKLIYSNNNISDTVDAILGYARNYGFEQIIMGTRGLTSLKGLIHGSLAHSLINKSEIPVLLIKKLPQNFVDRYCSADVYYLPYSTMS